MKMTDEIRISLTEAGVGKRYHNKTLADAGVIGLGALALMRRKSAGLASGKTSAVFEGVGTTEVLTLMARGMHINGVGCRVLPLVRMKRMFTDPEFREAINDIDCLVLLNAQDRHRCNPLQPYVAAEVEYLIRQRFENNRTTILQVAFTNTSASDGDVIYWSDEFWDMVSKGFEHVTPDQLIAEGKAT